MPILSNLIVRIGASTTDFDREVDKSLSKVKRFATDVTAAGTALSIGFSLPVIAAGGAAIKAASDMESLNMGLKAVMKTTDATAAEMVKLREVAKLPGLGLEEAVKGSIRLQILGNSADQSRRIMGELGNALAVVGGGKEDFSEVIRQLSQLGAVGKVTKENLDPIIERIPQLAAIIKEKFGAEALGDPAKVFERLGITSQQFIRMMIDELAKGELAGNTFKNSWQNIESAAKDAAASFGTILLPVAQKVLDDFLTPGIEKAKAMAEAFKMLSPATQNWALGLTAVATAAPLVIVMLGTLVEKGAILMGVVNKIIPLLKGLAGGISLVGTASVAAGAAVGYFIKFLIDHGEKPVDTTAVAIKSLNDKLGYTAQAAAQGREGLVDFMKAMPPATKAAEDNAGAHDKAAVAVGELTKQMPALARVTADSEALTRLMAEAQQEHSAAVDKGVDVMRLYGTVNVETALALAKAADEQFRLNRALDEAPDLHQKFDFKDIPKYNAAGLPVAIGKDGGDKNIGPEGMQTKEQYDAMARAAQSAGKAQSAAMRQVSTVITDLSRGIADVIFKGGKVADMFKSVASQAAQSITRLLIEGALSKLASKILDVGGMFGTVFGGGTGVIKSAVPGAGGLSGMLGGGGGSATSAAGSAVSGITGILGAVGSIGSMVSGIIGNFQNMAMNKSLDLIVKHTLQIANDLANLRVDDWTREGHLLTKLDDMWKTNLGIYDLLGGGGGATVTINVNGGDTKRTMDDLTRLLKQYGVIPRTA